jgi:hypothetical protein
LLQTCLLALSQPTPCTPFPRAPVAEPPLTALPATLDAFTTSELAISGVDTSSALTIKPEASSPTRAKSRDFIGEHPFADGLVGSWGLVQVKCKSDHLLKPGYLRKVHELASLAPRVAKKARSRALNEGLKGRPDA